MELFRGQSQVSVRAINMAERFDLSALEVERRISISPLVVEAGTEGCAVLFRYGVVVLFGLRPVEQAALLADLQKLCRDPYTLPPEEHVDIRVAPEEEERVQAGVILLRAPSLDRIQIVADILADSVILEYYERIIETTFDRVEPLATDLERGKRGGRRSKHLLQHIGGALLMEHKMVGRVEVAQKPDLLWERTDLEPLYQRLAKEYELHERKQALERKLQLVSRTVETVLDLLQQRRSLRVEWYIVILILIEIVLTLYELFVRH